MKNFEIYLIQRQRRISESGEREDFYIFNVEVGGNVVRTEVSESELESFGWVRKATHGTAYYMQKKGLEGRFYEYVHKVIEDEIATAPAVTCFESNGWHRVGLQWVYVEGSGSIGGMCKDVFGNPELRLIGHPALSEYEAACQFLNLTYLTVDCDKAKFLMAYVATSVLGTLYGEAGLPLQYVLAIVGTTNSMKTSIAKVFSNLWNAGEKKTPDVTFASTRGGLETYVKEYRDAILLVDDFMPADNATEMNQQIAKLKSLVRMYGDGVPIMRMAAGNATSRRPVNRVYGSCMITAEILPGIESSQTRIVKIPLSPGEVNTACLTYYQENPLIISTFLRGFIRYIAQDVEKTIRLIKGFAKIYRGHAGCKIPRFETVATQLRIGWDFVCEYLKTLGIDGEALRSPGTQAIYRIVKKNDYEMQKVNYASILADSLVYGITKKGGTKTLEKITEWGGDQVYEDEKKYYVTSNVLFQFYQVYCKSQGVMAYFTKSDMVKKLIENGMVETSIDERHYVQASRKLCQGAGNYQRFLYIHKAMIQKIVSGEDA